MPPKNGAKFRLYRQSREWGMNSLGTSRTRWDCNDYVATFETLEAAIAAAIQYFDQHYRSDRPAMWVDCPGQWLKGVTVETEGRQETLYERSGV